MPNNNFKTNENISGGASQNSDFGKWMPWDQFNEKTDTYEIKCPNCSGIITIPNNHKVMNFLECKNCPSCNTQWLIRRFNAEIQVQRIS